MRCSMCGHDSPAGSLFCLSCGSALAAGGGTPGAGAPLPGRAICPGCRAENPPGMKFCRHCGTGLGAPAFAPPPAPPPPYGYPPPGAPPMGPPGGIVAGGIEPRSAPIGAEDPRRGVPAPVAPPSACPRCGAPTQPGFMFCQQCGHRLGGSAPAPGPGVDALAGTLAAQGAVAEALRAQPVPPRVAAGLAPTPAAGGWGSAVSVNRDGSDGDRFPLAGEFVVIGRTSGPGGADVAFDQDRFLARQHARLEPTPDGAARVVPIDTLNGVYRKIDAAVELADGVIVLAGREVLRFEIVDADEKAPTPLVRHGVALFGSPPRDPWGRLVQLLPSGGVRDVRHLWDDEIVIGREDGDLVFSDDQFLSRRHASIAWDGARARLKDLGSSNGTFVRLTGPTPIKHGDHLRMGDQLFRIELRR